MRHEIYPAKHTHYDSSFISTILNRRPSLSTTHRFDPMSRFAQDALYGCHISSPSFVVNSMISLTAGLVVLDSSGGSSTSKSSKMMHATDPGPSLGSTINQVNGIVTIRTGDDNKFCLIEKFNISYFVLTRYVRCKNQSRQHRA